MKYTVTYTHVVNRRESCTVEADSEEEALSKAADGDTLDEEELYEHGIEIKDYKISKLEQ